MKMIREDLVVYNIYFIFKYINKTLWNILMSPEVKKINIITIANLELDILFLF